MFKIKLQRDRALVSSPCLRITTSSRDHYWWWNHGLRYCWTDRDFD